MSQLKPAGGDPLSYGITPWQTRNARFWTMTPSADWVKITLRPGQPLKHHRGGPTEEGWHRQDTTFWLEDGFVHCATATDGTDCDGRLQTFCEVACHIDRLACRTPHESSVGELPPGTLLPDWQKVDESQRDFAAEAMGY